MPALRQEGVSSCARCAHLQAHSLHVFQPSRCISIPFRHLVLPLCEGSHAKKQKLQTVRVVLSKEKDGMKNRIEQCSLTQRILATWSLSEPPVWPISTRKLHVQSWKRSPGQGDQSSATSIGSTMTFEMSKTERFQLQLFRLAPMPR